MTTLTPPSDGKTADAVAGSAGNGKPPPSVAADSSTDEPDPNKPPDVAVRWMARNCPSNVDLATLSNVCARWRRVVAATITDDLLGPYANHLSDGGHSGRSCNGDTNGAKNGAEVGQNGGRISKVEKGGTSATTTDIKSCSRSDLAKLYPVASLLLPEMAMELLERRKDSMMNAEIEDENGGDNTARYSPEDGEALVPIKGGEEDDEGKIEADAKGADNGACGKENGNDENKPTTATADGEGQFCLAWFAPSGIQIQSVRVGDDGDDHSVSSASSEGIPDTDAASRRSSITPPFGPSGQETYDLSETEEVAADKDKARRRGYLSGKDSSGGGGAKGGGGGGGGGGGAAGTGVAGVARGPSPAPDPNSPLRRRPPMNRTVATGAGALVKKKKSTDDASGRLQTCALGWSSYLSAMDVLLPFGFSTSFVRSTLDHALELSALRWSTSEFSMSIETGSVSKGGPFDNLMATPITSNEPPKATFAVRGCTLARPDGYCLRWDEDEQDIEASLLNSEALGVGNGATSSTVQGQTNSSREENDRRRWEYRRRRARQFLKQRKRERKRVMRERLPRMITSTREKSPSYLGEELQHGFDGRGGRRQRSIQFLNADGDHAVRLRTTPFECGTIRSPVTVFCVAIATEDGCFFSGLRNRFELGHLYPQNPRDALVDMSPICLVTNQREDVSSHQAQVVVSKAGNSGGTGVLLSGSCSEGRKYFDDSCHSSIPSHMDSDDSSDDSSDDDKSSEGERCGCRFCSTRINADECDDEPDENVISRGLLGPGSWHCYVAIFDGESSIIRVDGITEPQTETEVCIPRNTPGLDGLTIGSDHVFDMSLCYGGGDEGEGEGAISELAVFKGRLPQEDIERMERYLMKKHGISPCSDQHERWQEDEWRRQSCALIAQPPPYRVRGEPVPLRVAANHRSVAWHRNCEVTGKEIAVSRIGCRYGAGSSDW